jgi:hypothetical protein
MRNACQTVLTFSQDSGRHNGQGGILRAAYFNSAFQAFTASYYKLVQLSLHENSLIFYPKQNN